MCYYIILAYFNWRSLVQNWSLSKSAKITIWLSITNYVHNCINAPCPWSILTFQHAILKIWEWAWGQGEHYIIWWLQMNTIPTYLAHIPQWRPLFLYSPPPWQAAGQGTGLEWYPLCSQTHHSGLGDNQQLHRNELTMYNASKINTSYNIIIIIIVWVLLKR